MRRQIALAIVGLFLVIDVLAWALSYRAATAPTPEELHLQAGATPIAAPSAVEKRGDGLYAEISLNGEWRYRQTGSEWQVPAPSQGEETLSYFSPELDIGAWRTMAIPQNWYLAGLNYHGVIWFRREFQADESWRGRAVRLRFDGVDYFADVWLNGEHLGHHEGYFQPFALDVTDQLNYDGSNALAVRVDSPYEEYGTVWHHHKTLIKGIFEHHGTRPGGGWGRAGQEYNTGGIWNDVTLVVSDYATVDGLQLRAAWPGSIAEGADAVLNVEAVVVNHADAVANATVTLQLVPRNFESDEVYTLAEDVTLRRGKTTVEISGTIPGPRLWWPWDRGEPNLYAAHLLVEEGGQVIAEREMAFGFRQIGVGEDWTWTINGQRFFPRGSNYISTQWLSETDEAWFLRDVRLMREANLNFIRVHAHVEPVEFYQAMDELGILVWQDFPLQWGYTDAPEFVDEALRQEQDMIALLYNHPSIVVWCGHNESPWDASWMADRVPDYDPRQNKRLDELLYDQAVVLDPTRYVHLNSSTGDAHPYPGWSQGKWWDFDNVPGAPFVTEYGAQALPNLETMQKMFSPQELVYRSGEVGQRWEFHDFQPSETFDIARIPRPRIMPGDPVTDTQFMLDLAVDLIADSQAYQANLVKFATESYRRAKYDPLKDSGSMQGIFHFMFVDDWPSITWSVVDYYRQPKAGYYALQTAMQPILPSIAPKQPDRLERERWVYSQADGCDATIWIVNDTMESFTAARLHFYIVEEDGEILKERTASIDISPDSVRWAAFMSGLDLAPGLHTLYVELFDAQGRELGQNEFSFAIEPLGE